MAKTGRRAEKLRSTLIAAGACALPQSSSPPRPAVSDLPSDAVSELTAIYEELGGLLIEPVFRPGPWDLLFAGMTVELDEELHFNRYRAMTLTASWTHAAPWIQDYREHCVEHESLCGKAGAWGVRWTSPSSAKMFAGGPAGDLNGAGAPRWKQRALYDLLKDASILVPGLPPLARVATHDVINGVGLGDALDGKAELDPEAVLGFVEARTYRQQ